VGLVVVSSFFCSGSFFGAGGGAGGAGLTNCGIAGISGT